MCRVCEFCENFKKSFFIEHLQWLLLLLEEKRREFVSINHLFGFVTFILLSVVTCALFGMILLKSC